MSDVLALIAKLEAAKEPDRLLDELVAFAVGWQLHRDAERTQTARWQSPDGAWHVVAPFFTFSLDAALSLVPADMQWHVNATANPGEYRAEVDYGRSVFAPSPALALCIAAFTARLHQEPSP